KAAAYAKLHQRASHFAIVGVAAALQVSGGAIQSARIGLTGAASHAIRMSEVEAALAGKSASRETMQAAPRNAGYKMQDVNSDILDTAEYRRAIVGVFAERALTRALERA